MSEKINFDYKELHPFKWFILENFPFLEDSIDGLTNYQLLVKLGSEINKNRDSINGIGLNAEALTDGYNSLVDYVDNYFNNLDVNDEINEKLDELVEDGTLTELIGAYCQPRIDYQDAQINEIKNKVDAVSSGSPAGVYATVADLTSANPDHSKIYLVTADGKWYYYNSSTTSWTAGGTYQSTSLVLDKSLDVSGQAPDSQTVGGRIKIIDSIYTTRLDPNLFENGGLNPSTGVNDNTPQYRFRSKTMLYSNNDITITVPIGIQIGFITYTSAGAFVSWSNFKTQNTVRFQILIPKNTYFRVMCQRVDPDTTEVINFVTVVNDMRVLINKTQNEKDIYDYVNNRLNTADFINGDISGNTLITNRLYRIMSKYVFSYPVQTSIDVPFGYQIGYHVYNSTTFDQQSWSEWTTGPNTLQVPANTSIRLLIKKETENTSQTLDINTTVPLFNCHPTTTENAFNNLAGTLRSYGATKFIIYGSSTVHRSVNNSYTMTLTFSNNIGYVFLPSSANESFKRVTMTHTTFTLDNNRLLVYNISSNDVEVITQPSFNANRDNFVLICWNHYGEIRGQLLDEYLSSIRNVSFETNTVEISCRQGEIDNYPENTLQAFKRAKEFGYNHIRLSFGWTSDGVAICSHFDRVSSSTLRNLNGTEIVDDTILLSNLTYEYIEENYDAGIYKGSKFAGIEVPTVAEVLIQAKKLNQKVDLEYKFGYTEQRLESLLEYIYTIGMKDVCLISSDNTSVINVTKASTNKLDVALIGHLNQTSVTSAISLGVNRLDIFSSDTYDSNLVLQLHQNNIKVKLGSSYNYADSVTYIEYYDVVECANQINPISIING